MTVSVITPAYNAGPFIRRAVESAANLPQVSEIIIVEDGSRDDTLAVCRELEAQFPKVKLYQHSDKGNHGAGATRNVALAMASGEYVAFLDADDYFFAHRFERDVSILNQEPDVDGVYGALGFHYYADAVNEEQISDELTTVSHPVEPEELLYVLLGISDKAKGYFSIDGLTVRRNVFDRIGVFDTDLELSQDTHLILRLATATRLVSGSIDRPVAMRGVHGGNRVSDSEKLDRFRMRMFESLYHWGQSAGMPARALEACHDKYLVWRTLHQGFVNNLRFLLRLPISNPRIFANHGQFSVIVQATFGRTIVARVIIGMVARLRAAFGR